MRTPSLSRLAASFGLIALFLGLGQSVVADTIVYSNNAAPGDQVNGPAGPVALGSSGWYYNNVTSGGSVGIRTDLPRNGNGSVVFNAVNPNGTSGIGKADMLYSTGAPLGQLKDLTSFAYDWYRNSASTTGLTQTVALKLMLSNDATKYYGASSKGEFIFEPYYSTGNVVSNTWVHEDIIANDGIMWTSGNLPGSAAPDFKKYSAFLDPNGNYKLGDYYVWGVIAGVGSGWKGTFEGAADNIKFGFGTNSTTYNFEVVPEPSSIVLSIVAGGIGLIGVARRRFRRSV